MKRFALFTLALAPLTAQAQGRIPSGPDFQALYYQIGWGVVELDGRRYTADDHALWVTEAGPDAFVVADTLTGERCLDTNETVLSGPPIVYDEALYFVAAEEKEEYPCAYSLWRYRPGGRIELVATGPFDTHDLTLIDGRFFAGGRDDVYGHAVFEFLLETRTYRGVVGADLGSPSMLFNSITALNGRLYFNGRDTEGSYNLWQYDPTSEESHVVVERREAHDVTPFNGRLFFVAPHEEASGLWVFDPASQSAVMVAAFEEGQYAHGFLVHNGRLFFRINYDGLRMYDPIAESLTAFGSGVQFGVGADQKVRAWVGVLCM